jgi:hypothetical protein
VVPVVVRNYNYYIVLHYTIHRYTLRNYLLKYRNNHTVYLQNKLLQVLEVVDYRYFQQEYMHLYLLHQRLRMSHFHLQLFYTLYGNTTVHLALIHYDICHHFLASYKNHRSCHNFR